MKVSMEKNMAFKDQVKPFLAKDIKRLVKQRKARKSLEGAKVDFNLLVSTIGEPKVESFVDDNRRAVLRVNNFKIGEHKIPQNIKSKIIPSLGAKSRTFSKALVSEPVIPDHLDLNPIPMRLQRRLQTPPFFASVVSKQEKKYGNKATTVFPPENRYVFNDTSYPWCTCGRVDTPNGYGSGVMVGPRHLLTVSHVIQWLPGNTAGWVRFRPAYFAPSAPFGEAWATLIYSKKKVTGPTISWTEGMYDYVVCVLDRNIGNWTGWMGAKGYTDAWDGENYWSHIGYPGDLTAGNRPTFEGSISLDGGFWEPDSHESMDHRGDVWPGQSGGPFFGWWSPGPYAVAVQSSQNSNENNASGGQDMVDLAIRARNEHP